MVPSHQNSPRSPRSAQLIFFLLAYSFRGSGFESTLTLPSLHSAHERVGWNREGGKCIPDVCNGVHLPDLPDAVGFLPVELARQMRLFDTPKVIQCLKNKRLLFLGDSLLGESVQDIVALLGGLAYSEERTLRYVKLTHSQQGYHKYWMPATEQDPVLDYPQGYLIENTHLIRNVTVTSTVHNFTLRFRFTGHVEASDNDLGIETFSHPDFQTELGCLLGDQPVTADCPEPYNSDVIVLHSGQHDRKKPLWHFTKHLRVLLERLKASTSRGVDVFWRGNGPLPLVEGIDAIVQQQIHQVNPAVQYVDIFGLQKYMLSIEDHKCFTLDGLHFGLPVRYNNPLSRVTIATLLTQKLMGSLCFE